MKDLENIKFSKKGSNSMDDIVLSGRSKELMNYDEKIKHEPVLLCEMIEYLKPRSGERYLDCTFGGGGYTRKILSSCDCAVVGIDRDPTLLSFINRIKDDFGSRFTFVQSNFADIVASYSSTEYVAGGYDGRKDGSIFEDCAILEGSSNRYDGVVIDLGVSSIQLESFGRGFSFSRDDYLDMRMSRSGVSAADFVSTASQKEIADIIFRYGDERYSRRIAKSIVESRKVSPITTTARLREIVTSAVPYKCGKIDPSTKTFQAIRIHINDEINSLIRFLQNLDKILNDGARVVIVSFHSIEDGIVKRFFKEHSGKNQGKSRYRSLSADDCNSGISSVKYQNDGCNNMDNTEWGFKILTKKPITPSVAEVARNPRSRSGKMRVAEFFRSVAH